jgi:hypothetical protein
MGEAHHRGGVFVAAGVAKFAKKFQKRGEACIVAAFDAPAD